MLKLNNIYKKFKNNIVLKDINLEFNEGDLVLIKGINGCGKTTLLKIIAGLIEVTSGSVEMNQKYDIGALIENPSFIEGKSLKYNLQFLYNLKNKYDEDSVLSLCEGFSLDLNNNEPMKNYSLGMRQKSGVIQAFMENQNLILLDEPTRGMDQESVVFFEALVNESIKEGKIVIIATHDYECKLAYNKIVNL